MTVRRIGHDELREERAGLAEAVANVFATPEFHETWWECFGAGRELLLHAVLDGDRLAGVLPLYAWRPGVRRFLGHGGGDELGPVALPEDAALVRAALEGLAGPLLLGDAVPPAWGGRVLRAERSPAIDLRAFSDWDAFLGSRSSNFRQQVRSRPRRLAREHAVVFREADAATLAGDLDTLFRLHRARWPEGSEFARHEAFHRAFAAVALERGWTSLVVLEVDGQPAAAWYGFRFGGVDAYYQSGRDPRFERESVGLVLLAHTIERAFAEGRTAYRFLRGDEPYKFRFTDDPAVVTTVAFGPLAPAAGAAARAFLVSRAAARRLARSRPPAPPGAASRPGA